MYEGFFEMTHTPFSRDVPPEALYESAAMTDALGRLSYAADKQLFAVVTSEAGCGKSTLIRKFAASLPREDYILLYLSDSKLTPRWFYKGLLDQLGIAVRTGHHCTQPIMDRYGIPGTVRASFAVYNTMEEVDSLYKALKRIMPMLMS